MKADLNKLSVWLYKNNYKKELSKIIRLGSDKEAANTDDIYLYTSISKAAIDSVKKVGLISGEELYKNPELLEQARPDKKDREEWIERFEKESHYNFVYKGPNCFFSIPPVDDLNDKHPIKKWDLVFVKINLSKLLDDYVFLKNLWLYGLELHPYFDEMTDEEYLTRKGFLTLEEVIAFTEEDPKKLWANYDSPEGTHYASDVPHVVVLLEGGCISPKYLEILED